MRFIQLSLAFSISFGWIPLLPQSAEATTIAHWRFESTNDTTDYSGFGNHATQSSPGTSFSSDVFGTPIPQTGAANLGSLQLNNNGLANTGVNAPHYLSAPDSNSLDIATGSFTIEAWVRLDVPGTSPLRQYIVQKKSTAPGLTDANSSYIFMAKAGNLVASADSFKMALGLPDGTANTNMIYSSLGIELISDTGWHYMSVGVDRANGDVRFMLDDQVDLQVGVLNHPTINYSGIDNDHPLFIGAHPAPFVTGTREDSANWGFDGNIDELRISNTFLPQSQLLAVPEPSSVVLGIVGTLLIGLVSWLRLKAIRARNRS